MKKRIFSLLLISMMLASVSAIAVPKVCAQTYPPSPKLSVLPEKVSNIPEGNNFISEIWLHAYDTNTGEITDLDPFWDVAGFEFYVFFNSTLIEVASVNIDPNGWFAAFWPNGIFIVLNEVDNVAGSVHIAFLGIPGDLNVHTAPFGQGVIAEITFNSIYETAKNTPPSCAIDLASSTVAGFPHEERNYPPWNGQMTAVALEHFVNDATYTAPQTLGDVNDDGKVDGFDIAVVAKAFGSYPGHPRWNPDADLSGDGMIDGKDITFVAKNFGKIYP